MNSVFQVYDGVNTESHAVDYLQSQVRLKKNIKNLVAQEMTDAIDA